jgi:hypothetical protein
MSQSQPPVGILVSVSDGARKPRKQPRPDARRSLWGQIPWYSLSIVASVAWMAVLVAVALCSDHVEGQRRKSEPLFADAAPVPAAPAIAPVRVVEEFDELPAAEPAPQQPPLLVPIAKAPPGVLAMVPQEVPAAHPPGMFPPGMLPPLNAPPLNPPVAQVEAPAPCGDYGTKITFVKNPVEAFQQAKKEKKLVFMIHLSGNFEDEGFT